MTSPKGKSCLDQDVMHLFRAVRKGKAHLTRFMLAASNNSLLNCWNVDGKTPLIESCYIKEEATRGHMVRLLKDAGADVNMTDRAGKTALIHACEQKCNDVVKILIQHANICPDVEDTDGNTALIHSANAGNDVALEMIVKSFRRLGLNVDHFNKAGYTALHVATTSGFLHCAKVLAVKGKASLTLKDKVNDMTPLEWCLNEGYQKSEVEFLKPSAKFYRLAKLTTTMAKYRKKSTQDISPDTKAASFTPASESTEKPKSRVKGLLRKVKSSSSNVLDPDVASDNCVSGYNNSFDKTTSENSDTLSSMEATKSRLLQQSLQRNTWSKSKQRSFSQSDPIEDSQEAAVAATVVTPKIGLSHSRSHPITCRDFVTETGARVYGRSHSSDQFSRPKSLNLAGEYGEQDTEDIDTFCSDTDSSFFTSDNVNQGKGLSGYDGGVFSGEKLISSNESPVECDDDLFCLETSDNKRNVSAGISEITSLKDDQAELSSKHCESISETEDGTFFENVISTAGTAGCAGLHDLPQKAGEKDLRENTSDLLHIRTIKKLQRSALPCEQSLIDEIETNTTSGTATAKHDLVHISTPMSRTNTIGGLTGTETAKHDLGHIATPMLRASTIAGPTGIETAKLDLVQISTPVSRTSTVGDLTVTETAMHDLVQISTPVSRTSTVGDLTVTETAKHDLGHIATPMLRASTIAGPTGTETATHDLVQISTPVSRTSTVGDLTVTETATHDLGHIATPMIRASTIAGPTSTETATYDLVQISTPVSRTSTVGDLTVTETATHDLVQISTSLSRTSTVGGLPGTETAKRNLVHISTPMSRASTIGGPTGNDTAKQALIHISTPMSRTITIGGLTGTETAKHDLVHIPAPMSRTSNIGDLTVTETENSNNTIGCIQTPYPLFQTKDFTPVTPINNNSLNKFQSQNAISIDSLAEDLETIHPEELSSGDENSKRPNLLDSKGYAHLASSLVSTQSLDMKDATHLPNSLVSTQSLDIKGYVPLPRSLLSTKSSAFSPSWRLNGHNPTKTFSGNNLSALVSDTEGELANSEESEIPDLEREVSEIQTTASVDTSNKFAPKISRAHSECIRGTETERNLNANCESAREKLEYLDLTRPVDDPQQPSGDSSSSTVDFGRPKLD